MGVGVVPDWGSAKVDTFWEIFENLVHFRVFHQQDALKRVSRHRKWILRKILRFPMSWHVSKLHLGFENHRFPPKSRPQPGSGGLPTNGNTQGTRAPTKKCQLLVQPLHFILEHQRELELHILDL